MLLHWIKLHPIEVALLLLAFVRLFGTTVQTGWKGILFRFGKARNRRPLLATAADGELAIELFVQLIHGINRAVLIAGNVLHGRLTVSDRGLAKPGGKARPLPRIRAGNIAARCTSGSAPGATCALLRKGLGQEYERHSCCQNSRNHHFAHGFLPIVRSCPYPPDEDRNFLPGFLET